MVNNSFSKAADGSRTNEVFYISPIVYKGIEGDGVSNTDKHSIEDAIKATGKYSSSSHSHRRFKRETKVIANSLCRSRQISILPVVHLWIWFDGCRR